MAAEQTDDDGTDSVDEFADVVHSLTDIYELHSSDAVRMAALIEYVEQLHVAAIEAGLEHVDPNGQPSELPLADLEARVDAVEALVTARSGLDLGEILAAATDTYLMMILADETLCGSEPTVLGALLLADRLTGGSSRAPRLVKAASQYLRGRGLEFTEGALAGERHYRLSLAAVDDYQPALIELAGLELDRGNYQAARSLADRAQLVPEHPIPSFLTEREDPTGGQAAASPRAGRNQPCPCGSGRKYKQCHGAAQAIRLESPHELAGIVYDKAVVYLQMRNRNQMGYMLEQSEEATDQDVSSVLLPIMQDVLLFNGGVLGLYLELRGELLPAAERRLAGSWLHSGLAVYEVLAVRPGEGMDLRDTTTGGLVTVTEVQGSRQVQANQLIWTRVVEVGGDHELYGGITLVAPHELATFTEFADADPEPVWDYLCERLSPPVLTTSEGDPLALCTASFRTDEPQQLAAELDDLLIAQDENQWVLYADEPGVLGGDSVFGEFTLDGHELSVSATSKPRMAAVLKLLEQVNVKLTKIRENVLEAEELREMLRRSE